MRYLIILSMFGIILSSCSKNFIPYSQELKEENGWGERDIRRIQFYTSDDVILQRKVQDGSIRIESGKIKMVDGKEVEEIVIKKKTKGVAVLFLEGNRMGISFEIDDNHYLTFGPNPNKGDRYYIYAKDWQNRIGQVTYNDVKYFTSPESSGTYLLVNLKKIKDWEIDQRRAKGRKVK